MTVSPNYPDLEEIPISTIKMLYGVIETDEFNGFVLPGILVGVLSQETAE